MVSEFIVETLIKPFFSEKLRVIKYYDQKHTAGRLLSSPNAARRRKGLALLFELATSYPYRVQEIVDQITAFLRDKFPQGIPLDPLQKEVLEFGLRSLTAIPRLDPNGFPYNFDIHQIRIEDMDLTRSNFRFFSLWGCQCRRVIFSHSTFEQADLGGVIFEDCSLEYADVKGAAMCGSIMDNGRPTQFKGTRLWCCNLKDADIRSCDLNVIDPVDLQGVQAVIQSKKLRVIGAAA